MPISEGRHRKIAPRHQDTLLSSASVISILIVSFNTAPELVACLESLARCAAALPHEIIVVDNGSTDGSVEAVRTRFPAVQLVTNQENLGFSKASNQALPLARGEYVLFLNPDSEMHPGTLGRLRYLSGATVLHHYSVSARKLPYGLTKRLGLQATYQYFIKHRGQAYARAYVAAVAFVGIVAYPLGFVRLLGGSLRKARRRWDEARVFVAWAWQSKAVTYTLPRLP